MFSATRLLGGLVRHGLGRSARRAVGMGGGGGMFGGPSVFGGSRGIGKGVVGTAAAVAGVAAVGGAAYMAYRHFKGPGETPTGAPAGPPGSPGGGPFPGMAATPMSTGSGAVEAAGFGGGGAPQPAPAHAPADAPLAAPTEKDEADALLLVRAMIAAAHVDGQLDATERENILGGLREAGLGAEEQRALEGELDAPKAIYELLGGIDSPDMAKQFYLVTLLAIDVDTEPERHYVRALPIILRLPPREVEAIHRELGRPALF